MGTGIDLIQHSHDERVQLVSVVTPVNPPAGGIAGWGSPGNASVLVIGVSVTYFIHLASNVQRVYLQWNLGAVLPYISPYAMQQDKNITIRYNWAIGLRTEAPWGTTPNAFLRLPYPLNMQPGSILSVFGTNQGANDSFTDLVIRYKSRMYSH